MGDQAFNAHYKTVVRQSPNLMGSGPISLTGVMNLSEPFEKASALGKGDRLAEALELMYPLEKQSRLSADVSTNTKIQLFMIDLCAKFGKSQDLINVITMLAKKRSLLKQAICSMVQACIGMVDKIALEKEKIELIDALRLVTEGKIFVEVERARVTRMLATIREKEGKIKEAFDLLNELQVETFGSMEKRERIEFILEQLRLAVLLNDWVKAQIISRKISSKTFGNESLEDLKIIYNELVIKIALQECRYLDCCKYYIGIGETSIVKNDPQKMLDCLKLAIIFAIMAEFSNEQSDILNKLSSNDQLDRLPIYKKLVRIFLTHEIIRWGEFQEIFSTQVIKDNLIFEQFDSKSPRWQDLRNRVTEHNIRTIERFYKSIRLDRVGELLDLNPQDAESILTELVTKKMVFARIDQPTKIINFRKRLMPNEVLDNWSLQVDKLLGLMVKTNHLISKEQMMYSLGQK